MQHSCLGSTFDVPGCLTGASTENGELRTSNPLLAARILQRKKKEATRRAVATTAPVCRRPGKGGFMRRYGLAILGAFALALFTVACGASDVGITTKVKSRLDTDRNVNAAQVQVTTQNKVATLSGAVESPAAKERAVALARG